MLTTAPKGTKDMLTKDAYKWHFIENEFKKQCLKHGFKELRTPVFEHTELFVRGVGDTTDIVQKEMYTWEQSKRSLTLRPEGTAAAVRSHVEHKIYAQPQPTKLYYDISCFRYEKPQSGRLRQFHQFGTEIFGSDNMLADSEIISLAYDFIHELGIKNVELQINSIGCPTCRAKYREALIEYLAPSFDELCEDCKVRYDKNPMRILDCKKPVCKKIAKDAPIMLDYLCDECNTAFEELKENLSDIGIEFVINPRIVRGLDYYTKTAFEFVTDSIGAQGTVCGGGRYDNLSEEIGGPPIPGVGFGLGKERLLLVMEANGIEIPNEEGINTLVAFMGEKAKKEALSLVAKLRDHGETVEIDCLNRNFKGQFKLADRLNVRNTIIIGDDEIEKGIVAIKKMETGDQITVENDIDKIIGELKK